MQTNYLKKSVRALALSFSAFAILAACSSDKDGGDTPTPVADPEFAVAIGTDNGRYLLPIKDLMSGKISPVGQGTNVSTIFTWEENIIQKGRDFYHVNPDASKFGKYRFEDGVLKTVKEIPFSHLPSLYIGWHIWIDDANLMVGPRGSNHYAIINVKDMAVTKSGEFDRKDIPEKFNRRVYSVIPRGNKLIIGFDLYNEETQKTNRKSYTAELDYPSLTNLKVTGEDSKSAPLGALRNGYLGHLDSEGDTYILTHPIPLGAGYEELPTAFYRVNKNDNKLDPNYFFNISNLLNGDQQLGVVDLGNSKVLLINAHDTKTHVKEWNDWWYAAMWQYVVVDIKAQKIVRKLDFPLLGNSRSAVVHQGKAYIAVNDPTADAVYVWEYDSNTDKLTKGAKIEGADGDTPMLYKLN